MKAITLLLLGVISAHKINKIELNGEVEDALINFEDGMEEEIDENAGLPYSNRAIKDAYFLQTDSEISSGTNNRILLEAQQRVEARRTEHFGEGCSLGETLHTGTALDMDDGEELLDDTAEYSNIGDVMDLSLDSQVNVNNKILVVAE